MKNLLIFLSVILPLPILSQTNITSTNPLAEQVLLGNYNPLLYNPAVTTLPDSIALSMVSEISPDSLKSYIIRLAEFKNRNTGSDTVSTAHGIGAARSWVHSKFQEFSNAGGNRLIPSYLQFDLSICGISRHKNIFAVLPGADTSDHQVILIEGHIDSRCAGLCDTACVAEGVEDNASGTALVMELARVMSRHSFKHTLVFMATIGEEQGLYGAEAFSDYVLAKQIPLKAVLNNDVIGGIICGATSSPPSCPGLNAIDSTQVRLFSHGGYNSASKQLARYIKLQYQEELLPLASVPMQVTIMSAEDRTGRGGDHIPFRQKGYPAMRFTSAHEHGDASNGPGYTDRQHTEDDLLGADTDNDGLIDSFFVDFNYLARNAAINGNAAGLMAISPVTPDLSLSGGGLELNVQIIPSVPYSTYRIAVRSTTNDWDTLYTTSVLSNTLYVPTTGMYYVSVASVDSLGVESLFSREYFEKLAVGIDEPEEEFQGVSLLQNRPNPFDEATLIGISADESWKGKKAEIVIADVNGRPLRRLSTILEAGINEVLYEHGYHVTGTYVYSLYIDEKLIGSRKMQFVN